MKEVIASFANYNRGANAALIDALDKAGGDTAVRETGTYYKTILATMQHCLWYEVTWLKRYRPLGAFASLATKSLDEEVDALKTRIGADYPKTIAYQKEIDAIFVEFTKEARPEDFVKTLSFKNARGEEQQRICWQTIFHVLNHSTHHRGEISGVLDRFGVANDFAGFFRYL